MSAENEPLEHSIEPEREGAPPNQGEDDAGATARDSGPAQSSRPQSSRASSAGSSAGSASVRTAPTRISQAPMGDDIAIDRESGVPNEGDVIAGKYRVERVLGKGGMGVVVAARHTSLRQHVAVKFLLPKAMQL